MFNYLGSTQYNDEDGIHNSNANFSDYVAVETPLLEAPALPTIDLETGRQTLEDRGQTGSVGFSARE